MITLVANQPGIAEWVRERIPKVAAWMPGFKSLAALWKEPEVELIPGYRRLPVLNIMGAVVYDNFTPYECCVHIAIADRRCVTRQNIRAVFAYPFEQLHLARVTAQIAPSNTRSLALAHHLGFLHEGTKRKGLGDESELIFGLTREDCRWL